MEAQYNDDGHGRRTRTSRPACGKGPRLENSETAAPMRIPAVLKHLQQRRSREHGTEQRVLVRHDSVVADVVVLVCLAPIRYVAQHRHHPVVAHAESGVAREALACALEHVAEGLVA